MRLALLVNISNLLSFSTTRRKFLEEITCDMRLKARVCCHLTHENTFKNNKIWFKMPEKFFQKSCEFSHFYWNIPVCRKSVLYLNFRVKIKKRKKNLILNFFHYSQSNLSLTLTTKIPPQKIRMHKERNCRGHLNADPEKSTCILRLKLNDEWPPMPEKENEWMV